MNQFYKVFLSAVLFLTVLFILVVRWFDHPLPQYEGQKILSPLGKKVDVYTDKFGVPHVFADNESDLFFTAGYIAARDRMFQLSMVSLAVEGKLASVLGKKYLSTDIYLRTWKIHETAKKLIQNMSPENRAIFEAFCKGINYRIDETEKDPPIEFKILNFKAPDWNPVTVAGYARLMAHEMSGSWKPEIVFEAIEAFYEKKN
jgi:Protein related to penicillin acylase